MRAIAKDVLMTMFYIVLAVIAITSFYFIGKTVWERMIVIGIRPDVTPPPNTLTMCDGVKANYDLIAFACAGNISGCAPIIEDKAEFKDFYPQISLPFTISKDKTCFGIRWEAIKKVSFDIVAKNKKEMRCSILDPVKPEFNCLVKIDIDVNSFNLKIYKGKLRYVVLGLYEKRK
jgi:hypothetical protein